MDEVLERVEKAKRRKSRLCSLIAVLSLTYVRDSIRTTSHRARSPVEATSMHAIELTPDWFVLGRNFP